MLVAALAAHVSSTSAATHNHAWQREAAAAARRECHRQELRVYVAQMVPQHAATFFEDGRRRRSQERRRDAQLRRRSPPVLWPGIIYDSSRWTDRPAAERNELRRQERAEKGIGANAPLSALKASPRACPRVPYLLVLAHALGGRPTDSYAHRARWYVAR